jgi:hypothetical protein
MGLPGFTAARAFYRTAETDLEASSSYSSETVGTYGKIVPMGCFDDYVWCLDVIGGGTVWCLVVLADLGC